MLATAYLQRRHTDDLVSVVEESWQDVEYRRFRKYQFLWGTGEERQTEHEQTDHKPGRSSRHKKALSRSLSQSGLPKQETPLHTALGNGAMRAVG